MHTGRPSRPPRPPSLDARKLAFLQEVLDEAVADGLVALRDASHGEEPSYDLTPEGQEWLRDFPSDLLACYPCRPAFWERA